jgi:hypothetical protein
MMGKTIVGIVNAGTRASIKNSDFACAASIGKKGAVAGAGLAVTAFGSRISASAPCRQLHDCLLEAGACDFEIGKRIAALEERL